MTEKTVVLVTGGAGFIGSAVCRHLVRAGARVINLDKLTYAGNLASLEEVAGAENYRFVEADINDRETVVRILEEECVSGIMHLAAESHVDRSIDSPADFIDTNILGTYRLLEAAHDYWRSLESARRQSFRFHHVSTDEVFGDLPFDHGVFTEETRYDPSSPYSASKAAADHLVRAWHRTYGLPVVLSNCSNNFGPYQYPEKLIPLVILNAIEGRPLPVYGEGANIRDWLFVEDHARALEAVLRRGTVGETYLIGGRAERTNVSVVREVCRILDEKRPRPGGARYTEMIEFVQDRPGHDRRYAIDPSKAEAELGWGARESFESGLAKTIDWYLEREDWWRPLREVYLGQRLGVRDHSAGE